MMNTESTANAVNDEVLAKTVGGDWGDSTAEKKGWIPMYWTGCVVEVYTNFLHWFTKRGKIIRSSIEKIGVYRYLVEFEDGSQKWVEASDIEYDANIAYGYLAD